MQGDNVYMLGDSTYVLTRRRVPRDAGARAGELWISGPEPGWEQMFICDNSQTYVPAQVKHAGLRDAKFRTNSSFGPGFQLGISGADPVAG